MPLDVPDAAPPRPERVRRALCLVAQHEGPTPEWPEACGGWSNVEAWILRIRGRVTIVFFHAMNSEIKKRRKRKKTFG